MSHVTGGPSGPYAYHPQQQPKRKGLMPLIFGGLTLLVGTPPVSYTHLTLPTTPYV